MAGSDLKVAVLKTFEEFRAEAEDLFAEMFSDFTEPGTKRVRRTGYRIEKSKDELVIEVDIPGTPKENVRVLVASRSLRVEWTPRGKEKQELEFSIGRRADLSSVSAKAEDGLLTIGVKALPPSSAEEREVAVG